MSLSGLGRLKTRHRGRDVKYSSKQQAKYTIKQHHGSQSRVLMEYYSSVTKRDGVFTRPWSFASVGRCPRKVRSTLTCGRTSSGLPLQLWAINRHSGYALGFSA